MKLYFIIVLVFGAFPHILATDNKCDVLFLQSNSITFDLMDRLEVGVNNVTKAVLPDAVIYHTTVPNGTTKLRISSVNYEVSLIVIPMLTNLPDPYQNSTRIVQTFCGDGKIGVLNLMDVKEDSLENHKIAVEKEIRNLSDSGVNIIIAALPNNDKLTEEIINAELIKAVVKNTGEIWTKTRAIELLQNEENDPKALLVSFDKNGDIIRSEENSILPHDFNEERLENRIKRSDNDTQMEASEKPDGSEEYNEEDIKWKKIFLAGRMNYRDCLNDECSLGNFIADTFAFYARWNLNRHDHRWSRYPIALFHDSDWPLRDIRFSRGFYSQREFRKPFANIKSRVCVCYALAKLIGDVIMKVRRPIYRIHISGLFVWKSPDNWKKFATVRNSKSSDGSFVRAKDFMYGVIGSENVLKELHCIMNCKKVNKNVEEIVGKFVAVHKNIIPQSEFRYWTLSWDQINQIEHGYGRSSRRSAASTTRANLKILLSFYIFYVIISFMV